MADEIVTDLIEAKLDLHEARMPHASHEACEARFAALEAEIAELRSGMHRHEGTDDFDIEEVDEA